MSNTSEWSSRSRGEVASTFLFKFSERKIITWHEMWQSLQPHHCIVWQWRVYPNCKTCKKWKITLSSSMAMYSVMRDIHDTRRVPYGKRMSCSLLIWHRQIFKLIKFRTMGLWKLITFLIRTVYQRQVKIVTVIFNFKCACGFIFSIIRYTVEQICTKLYSIT